MKQDNQNFIIAVLLILLGISIILNFLQGNQVERLMQEVQDLEYVQSVMSSQIQSLEAEEGLEDGE